MKSKFIIVLILLIVFVNILYSVYAQETYSQYLIPATETRNNGINNFPESYKILLQKLVNKTGHKNWKFVAFYTDIDWNELIEEEHTHLKNTIIKSSTTRYPDEWYCSCRKEGDKKKQKHVVPSGVIYEENTQKPGTVTKTLEYNLL